MGCAGEWLSPAAGRESKLLNHVPVCDVPRRRPAGSIEMGQAAVLATPAKSAMLNEAQLFGIQEMRFESKL